ncbi:YciI family protein [Rhodococcus erythropolis]|uniref:YciI family protein n=1 Tax=Rhodococcus erythropolis TaxID=1833 RepID=UPI002949C24F|nr:YciI family protein [Rhodococcus erythropolis]MDV6276954.1 YciI family protein [Rhodococcus erythropolis]
MVTVYERFVPNSTADVAPEILEAHMRLPSLVERAGGKILYGRGARPPQTAKSIRGGEVCESPFTESVASLAGFYVIEAADLDHAVEIGKLIPVADGGVEVRPVITD